MRSANHKATEYNQGRVHGSICLITIARIFHKRIHLLISVAIASVALTACGPLSLDAKSMQVLKNIKPRIIRVADAGHFILWKQPEIIRDAILEALDQNCQTNKIQRRAVDRPVAGKEYRN